MDDGTRGERLAARFLQRSGYRVIRRNFRVRGGELDLIARQGDTLVFVEVKTSRGRSVDPCARVDRRKQQRLTRAAKAWVRKRRCEAAPCRFDVVLVELGEGDPRIEHLPDAFAPHDWG